MAKDFDGFEVVVATHIDRDHCHNHFVVNSVNSENGLIIQINEKGLEELRNRSDEICQQFELELLKSYQKPKQRSLNQREYRTALRSDSKKPRLMNAIDMAVVHSRSKEKFIENMKRLGYGVKWIDRYKYITYTAPDGQRFRDNRLFGDKYLKKTWRIYMDLNQLQQMNQIQMITDQTVNALTEPIQPKYLMLKPEQYNLLAEHISMIGNAIVRNTDLIAKLPTQEGLENLITNEVRYWMSNTQDSVQNGMNSVKSSMEKQLKNQTDSMQKIFGTELQKLKVELQAATRTKVQWFLLGAILPTVLLILQLIWR
ncbi:MAG: relaxase/mobilization nuclease domain-containing protein [Ruminococcus sp.]|nr:relaxase/mobilization nuclease domain-containing protein [Ruminococcus sp.]